MASLVDLQTTYQRYCSDRDWLQFHNPQSLTLALTAEVGEIAELLQWLSAAQLRMLSTGQDSQLNRSLRHEIADVLIYTISLANHLHINLEDAFEEKFAIIRDRHVKTTETTSPR